MTVISGVSADCSRASHIETVLDGLGYTGSNAAPSVRLIPPTTAQSYQSADGSSPRVQSPALPLTRLLPRSPTSDTEPPRFAADPAACPEAPRYRWKAPPLARPARAPLLPSTC